MEYRTWNKANAKRPAAEAQCVVCSAVLPGNAQVGYVKPSGAEYQAGFRAVQACITHTPDVALAAAQKQTPKPAPSGAQDGPVTVKDVVTEATFLESLRIFKAKYVAPLEARIASLEKELKERPTRTDVAEIVASMLATKTPATAQAKRTSPVQSIGADTLALCNFHAQSKAAENPAYGRAMAKEWIAAHKVDSNGQALVCEYVKKDGAVCGSTRGVNLFTPDSENGQASEPSDDELETPAAPAPKAKTATELIASI